MIGASKNYGDPASPHRIRALDLLRGIAAFIVVLAHVGIVFPESWHIRFGTLVFTPLYTLVNGQGAVIVFFVLSGFVLALPYYEAKALNYPNFIIRRVCRIYIPFAAAIVLSAMLYMASDRNPIAGMDSVFNYLWQPKPLTFTDLAGHLLMFGVIDQIFLDNPMWSLVHELRISLIFPFLILACVKTKRGILVLLGVQALAYVLVNYVGNYLLLPIVTQDLASTFLLTLNFVPCFLLGILLAQNRAAIVARLRHWPRALFGACWMLIFVAFCLDSKDYILTQLLQAPAAGLAIMLILASARTMSWLNAPVLLWLGAISYSLYLVHSPIIMAAAHALHDVMPIWAVMLCGFVLSFAVATLMHKFIEVPAIRLGRRLTKVR